MYIFVKVKILIRLNLILNLILKNAQKLFDDNFWDTFCIFVPNYIKIHLQL